MYRQLFSQMATTGTLPAPRCCLAFNEVYNFNGVLHVNFPLITYNS